MLGLVALELRRAGAGVGGQSGAHCSSFPSASLARQLDQGLAAIHLVADGDQDLGDLPVARALDRELHLHRLEHDQDVALGDRGAGVGADLDHHARHRRLQRAAGAGARRRAGCLGELVAHRRRCAVDQPDRALVVAQRHRPRFSVDLQGASPEPKVGRRSGGISIRGRHLGPAPVGRRLGGLDRDFDLAVGAVEAGAGPGGLAEAPAVAGVPGVVAAAAGRAARQRHGGEHRVGRGWRDLVAEALDQPGVDLAGAHLGPRQQRPQVGGVRRRPDHQQLAEPGLQAGQRLAAVGPVGDHLRQHRVVVGADLGPGSMPLSTRTRPAARPAPRSPLPARGRRRRGPAAGRKPLAGSSA